MLTGLPHELFSQVRIVTPIYILNKNTCKHKTEIKQLSKLVISHKSPKIHTLVHRLQANKHISLDKPTSKHMISENLQLFECPSAYPPGVVHSSV